MLICPELFLMSVFDPCISRGQFFGPIFRLSKVDLYTGKYGIYKFIACKLPNTSFVSITKRKLHERCRTGIQYVAKFCVPSGDLLFCVHKLSLAE